MVLPDGNEGEAGWSGGLRLELHASLSGGAPSLECIALHAAADDVVPAGLTALASGYHVIETHLAERQLLAAVLAALFVAGEEVATAEPHGLLNHAVKTGEAHDAWRQEPLPNELNPVTGRLPQLILEGTQLAPAVKVVVHVTAVLDVDNFGGRAVEEQAGLPDRDDMDGDVRSIEDQDAPAQHVCLGTNHPS